MSALKGPGFDDEGDAAESSTNATKMVGIVTKASGGFPFADAEHATESSTDSNHGDG